MVMRTNIFWKQLQQNNKKFAAICMAWHLFLVGVLGTLCTGKHQLYCRSGSLQEYDEELQES
jgi:Mn2+/Fe2+ NRAMP family transporter